MLYAVYLFGFGVIIDDSLHEGLIAPELLEAFLKMFSEMIQDSVTVVEFLEELTVLLILSISKSFLV